MAQVKSNVEGSIANLLWAGTQFKIFLGNIIIGGP